MIIQIGDVIPSLNVRKQRDVAHSSQEYKKHTRTHAHTYTRTYGFTNRLTDSAIG